MDDAKEQNFFVFVPSSDPGELSNGAIIVLGDDIFITIPSKDFLARLPEMYPEDVTLADLPALRVLLDQQPLQEINTGSLPSYRVGGTAGDVLMGALGFYAATPPAILAIQRKFEGDYYADFYDCTQADCAHQPMGLLRLDETVTILFSREQAFQAISNHPAPISETLRASLVEKILSSKLPDNTSALEESMYTIAGMVGSLLALALFNQMHTMILEEVPPSEAN